MSNDQAERMKIGLIMPIAEDDERHTTCGYAEIRAITLQAEAASFDSIWVYDHLLYRTSLQLVEVGALISRAWAWR